MGNKLNKALHRETKPSNHKTNTSNSSTIGMNNHQGYPDSRSNTICCIKINTTKRMVVKSMLDESECTTFEAQFTNEGETAFDTTPQTPPTPTLMYPYYGGSSLPSHSTLSHSNSYTSISSLDYEDSNMIHNSIIYLKNSYSSQYL